MSTKESTSVDALFGSKTRVKLLHLFMNNPETSFYVREITRLIDEQINSVRRELSNMLNVGVILSENADNKLYYKVNKKYEHYASFRGIFSDEVIISADTKQAQPSSAHTPDWGYHLEKEGGIRVAIAAGTLVPGSGSSIDLLVVGDKEKSVMAKVVSRIESDIGRDLNYSLMSYDDFYYRLSVRDKFLTSILGGRHTVIVDRDTIVGRTDKRKR
jgi:hypothetical protein